MMKYYYALLVVGALCFSVDDVVAKPRSFSQAKKIAQNVGEKYGLNPILDKQATRDSRFFVFNYGSEQGFSIISADDQFPQVLGYCPKGTFDREHLPLALQDLLRTYEANTALVNTGVAPMSEMNYSRSSRRVGLPVVQPLVRSSWGQGEPFNRLTPSLSEGTHCATGCVATAMAQAINVYKHPSQLLADIPAYNWNNIHVDAIASGTAYDWDNILDDYRQGYDDAQALAVAQLMLHCGASVRMEYGWESGANMIYVPDALVDCFGMDPDLTVFTMREYHTADRWVELLDNEITAERPIIFGAKNNPDTYSGHAFILDGRDADGLYHVNWGWDGSADGYYDLSILNPYFGNQPNNEPGYVYNCHAIIGITPDNGVEDEPLVKPVDFFLTEWANKELELTLWKYQRNNANDTFGGFLYPYITNRSGKEVTGYFSAGILNEEGVPVNIGSNYITLDVYPDAIWECRLNFSYPIPVGTQQLYVLVSKDLEHWELLDGYEKYPVRVEVTDTDMMVFPRYPGSLTTTDKDIDDLDLFCMKNMLLGKNYDWMRPNSLDVNGDGKIDGFDYVSIVNVIDGNELPKPKRGADITMTVPSIEVKAGECADLNISLINPSQEVTFMHINLQLPSGFTIKNSRYGKPMIKLNNDRLYDDEELDIIDDHIISCQYNSNKQCYEIIVSSETSTPLKGENGRLLTIKLCADALLSTGDYNFTVHGLASDRNCVGNDQLVVSRIITVTETGSHIATSRLDAEEKSVRINTNGTVMDNLEPHVVYIQGGNKRLVKK